MNQTNTSETQTSSKSIFNNKDFIKKIIALGVFALLAIYLASISPSITEEPSENFFERYIISPPTSLVKTVWVMG